jgi:large conductance mechanosensitive channel
MKIIGEFRAFLTKTNALALAVGVIIGAAVGKVVSAMSDDILMPILTFFLPGGDWREARIVLKSVVDPATGKPSETAILYGHFAGAFLDFVIISLVLFFVVKLLVRPVATSAPEPLKTCPECLDQIPQAARRCRSCTAVLA